MLHVAPRGVKRRSPKQAPSGGLDLAIGSNRCSADNIERQSLSPESGAWRMRTTAGKVAMASIWLAACGGRTTLWTDDIGAAGATSGPGATGGTGTVTSGSGSGTSGSGNGTSG